MTANDDTATGGNATVSAGPDISSAEPSAEVMDYIRRNPDFLIRPEVLEIISPKGRWDGDGVVDMQQFMLERLRDEIDNLRNCAQEVINTSRSNMSVQTRTHAAVLAVLAVGDFNHLLQVIADDLPLLLDVDIAAIGFEPPYQPDDPLETSSIRHLEEGAVDQLLGPESDILLTSSFSDDGTFFGEGAGLVSSAAIARIRPGLTTPAGILALGSRSRVFHSSQGSELLSFLARVLERALHRWLEKKY